MRKIDFSVRHPDFVHYDATSTSHENTLNISHLISSGHRYCGGVIYCGYHKRKSFQSKHLKDKEQL